MTQEPGLCEIQFYKKDENNQFQKINKVTFATDTEGWAGTRIEYENGG